MPHRDTLTMQMPAQKTSRITYHIKTLREIELLVHTLAEYYPESASLTTAIYELLFNAIEHGNMEIGFETKTELLRNGTWHEEIARRQYMKPYADRMVSVSLETGPNGCVLCIADEGKGFNWQRYCNGTDSSDLPNGRGLQIVMQAGFDQVVFNDAGNAVTCIVHNR